MSQSTLFQLTSGNTAVTSGNTSAVQVVTLPTRDQYGAVDAVTLLNAAGATTGLLPVTCAVTSATPVSGSPVQVQLTGPQQLTFGANAPLLGFSTVAPPVSGGVVCVVHGRPLIEMQQTS